MRQYFLIIICCIAFHFRVEAQLKMQTGERFLPNLSFKKIHVCLEDHSVWAITEDGKVYTKKTSDLDFSLYALTADLTVTALSGFNADEMYFVSNNEISVIKNGIIDMLVVSFPGVTRINDISAVFGRDNVTTLNNGLNYKDYLAIATNKSFYYALRGNITATLVHNYVNPPSVAEPDGTFGYTGFKGLDLRFLSPSDYCGVNVDRLTESITFGFTSVSLFPDKGSYNPVNATISARNFYFPFQSSSAYSLYYSIWGSSNGLFIRSTISCNQSITKHQLNGEHINDIEEIYALTPIYKQDYLIAATKTGIYFTPESIFNLPLSDANAGNFVKLNEFPTKNVTAIATETDYLGVFSHGQDRYYSLCERVVWASTESGIHKLYLNLDQDYFDNYKWADFTYSKPPLNGNFNDLKFETCGSENLTVTARIPMTFSTQILIKWFKDGIEIPSSIGKLELTIHDSGVYTTKVTSLCENITITSTPITLNNYPGPQITFTPASVVNICDQRSYLMETKSVNGYSYQWFKDEVRITGATQYQYSAVVTGKYRVEVKNNTCNITASSSSVLLNFVDIPVPQVIKNKSDYCIGDVAQLSVANLGYQVKWYKNGVEIANSADQLQISTTQAGIYSVSYTSLNCSNSSINYPISFNSLPTANVSRSSAKILCYGETVLLSAKDIPDATYMWNTGEKTREIKVGQTGKYKVTVSNAANCSVESTEVEVLVNEDLRFENPVIYTNKNDYCTGETALLTVANLKALKTKWYLDGVALLIFENKNMITTQTPGKYQVSLLNALGCEIKSFEVPITFNNSINVVISASSNKMICEGETVILSAGVFPKAKYLWSNGEKTETINVKKSGQYRVTVTSEFSCTKISDPVNIVVNQLPSLTLNEKLKLCTALKEELVLKADPGFVNYVWKDYNTKGSTLKVNQPGVYTVEVEDVNGCKANKTFEVAVACQEVITTNAFTPNGDGINDLWKVSGLENEPNATIFIHNRFGALIFKTNGNSPFWDGNVSNVPSPVGTYYYIIYMPSGKKISGELMLFR